jgi:hypothetical protein
MGDCIKQGSELRRGAQEAILALFNLNTPQVTMRFAQLPKEYQVRNHYFIFIHHQVSKLFQFNFFCNSGLI